MTVDWVAVGIEGRSYIGALSKRIKFKSLFNLFKLVLKFKLGMLVGEGRERELWTLETKQKKILILFFHVMF